MKVYLSGMTQGSELIEQQTKLTISRLTELGFTVSKVCKTTDAPTDELQEMYMRLHLIDECDAIALLPNSFTLNSTAIDISWARNFNKKIWQIIPHKNDVIIQQYLSPKLFENCTMQDFFTAVANFYEIDMDTLLKSRALNKLDVITIKYSIFHILRKCAGLTLSQIGNLANAHHSTVLHGVNRIDSFYPLYPDVRSIYATVLDIFSKRLSKEVA